MKNILKKSEADLFALTRIQSYEKSIAFTIEKLDEMLVTDSEPQPKPFAKSADHVSLPSSQDFVMDFRS